MRRLLNVGIALILRTSGCGCTKWCWPGRGAAVARSAWTCSDSEGCCCGSLAMLVEQKLGVHRLFVTHDPNFVHDRGLQLSMNTPQTWKYSLFTFAVGDGLAEDLMWSPLEANFSWAQCEASKSLLREFGRSQRARLEVRVAAVDDRDHAVEYAVGLQRQCRLTAAEQVPSRGPSSLSFSSSGNELKRHHACGCSPPVTAAGSAVRPTDTSFFF